MSRRPVCTFTSGEAAKRWRCSLDTAQTFLRDFRALGFVVEVDGRYSVTHEGVLVAEAVQSLEPEGHA